MTNRLGCACLSSQRERYLVGSPARPSAPDQVVIASWLRVQPTKVGERQRIFASANTAGEPLETLRPSAKRGRPSVRFSMGASPPPQGTERRRVTAVSRAFEVRRGEPRRGAGEASEKPRKQWLLGVTQWRRGGLLSCGADREARPAPKVGTADNAVSVGRPAESE